jgi:hypothetical protein
MRERQRSCYKMKIYSRTRPERLLFIVIINSDRKLLVQSLLFRSAVHRLGLRNAQRLTYRTRKCVVRARTQCLRVPEPR